jgi:NifU-like protein involved in Fe-S cluster formation
MIDDLYSTAVLRLAANLPRLGRLADPDGSAEKVARLCGSRILVDLKLKDGLISDFAQEVKACALGQAAASILGAHVIGASPAEIELTRDAFRAMLKSGGSPPEGRFSELAMLAPVKDYPARHASTLLAFEATVEACARAQVASSTPSPTTGTRTSPAGAA